MKILIRIGKCEATPDRGAHFLPTIGTVTPKGFTTSHPELDHGAMREILSPCSTKVRGGVYSPPPT
jgi:hypothetical protein